jgi:hypothetical protein
MNVQSKTETPQRVTSHENREVGGEALVCKEVREHREERVAELRAREQAYWESLPDEPTEALNAVTRALPDMGDFDHKPYAARAALVLTHELAGNRLFVEGSDELNDAMFWLTSRAIEGLDETEAKVDHARAIATKLNSMQPPFEA